MKGLCATIRIAGRARDDREFGSIMFDEIEGGAEVRGERAIHTPNRVVVLAAEHAAAMGEVSSKMQVHIHVAALAADRAVSIDGNVRAGLVDQLTVCGGAGASRNTADFARAVAATAADFDEACFAGGAVLSRAACSLTGSTTRGDRITGARRRQPVGAGAEPFRPASQHLSQTRLTLVTGFADTTRALVRTAAAGGGLAAAGCGNVGGVRATAEAARTFYFILWW